MQRRAASNGTAAAGRLRDVIAEGLDSRIGEWGEYLQDGAARLQRVALSSAGHEQAGVGIFYSGFCSDDRVKERSV